jgi:hypothetical protein
LEDHVSLMTRQDASALAGAAITFTQATASDTLVGGQCVHLLLTNTSGSTCTVTIVTPETVEGSLAVADRVISLLTATTMEIPIPSRYNDPTTGLTTVTFGAPAPVATITRAAVQTTPQP